MINTSNFTRVRIKHHYPTSMKGQVELFPTETLTTFDRKPISILISILLKLIF